MNQLFLITDVIDAGTTPREYKLAFDQIHEHCLNVEAVYSTLQTRTRNLSGGRFIIIFTKA